MWLLTRWLRLVTVYFYSHIPCGMWQEPSWESLDLLEISTHTSRVGCDTVNGADNPEEWGFLLTHPVWDVTPNRTRKRPTMRKISTHTSRVGCDDTYGGEKRLLLHFYSHIPCGMWQGAFTKIPSAVKFLLTHPVWDVTTVVDPKTWTDQHFYSHIPCGMWPLGKNIVTGIINFYSHIPCGMWHRLCDTDKPHR